MVGVVLVVGLALVVGVGIVLFVGLGVVVGVGVVLAVELGIVVGVGVVLVEGLGVVVELAMEELLALTIFAATVVSRWTIEQLQHAIEVLVALLPFVLLLAVLLVEIEALALWLILCAILVVFAVQHSGMHL